MNIQLALLQINGQRHGSDLGKEAYKFQFTKAIWQRWIFKEERKCASVVADMRYETQRQWIQDCWTSVWEGGRAILLLTWFLVQQAPIGTINIGENWVARIAW